MREDATLRSNATWNLEWIDLAVGCLGPCLPQAVEEEDEERLCNSGMSFAAADHRPIDMERLSVCNCCA